MLEKATTEGRLLVYFYQISVLFVSTNTLSKGEFVQWQVGEGVG